MKTCTDCGSRLGRWNRSGICSSCARQACTNCGAAIQAGTMTGFCGRCHKAHQRAEREARLERERAGLPGICYELPADPETAPLASLFEPLSANCQPSRLRWHASMSYGVRGES